MEPPCPLYFKPADVLAAFSVGAHLDAEPTGSRSRRGRAPRTARLMALARSLLVGQGFRRTREGQLAQEALLERGVERLAEHVSAATLRPSGAANNGPMALSSHFAL